MANFSLRHLNTDLTASGDLLGGIGNAFSDFASSDASRHSATIDEINRGFSMGMTRIDVMRSEQRAAQIEGAQKAGIGASGLATSGSALDVLRDTAQKASLDKSLAQFKGGVNTLDWNERYRADKAASSSSFLGGILDVGKGLLTAAAVLA